MKIEMVGRRFGRWTVIKETNQRSGSSIMYECRCDCGVVRPVNGQSLRNGKSASCGCLNLEVLSSQTGDKNPHWKGGRYINDAGYVMVYDPDHPRAMSNGYVREHIIISERAFGGGLPANAQIHHYGHVSDNSKLVVCEDQEYHLLLHIRSRALKACGDANKRKCKFCRKYDSVENLYIQHSKLGHGWNIYHKDCRSAYNKKMAMQKKAGESC